MEKKAARPVESTASSQFSRTVTESLFGGKEGGENKRPEGRERIRKRRGENEPCRDERDEDLFLLGHLPLDPRKHELPAASALHRVHVEEAADARMKLFFCTHAAAQAQRGERQSLGSLAEAPETSSSCVEIPSVCFPLVLYLRCEPVIYL